MPSPWKHPSSGGGGRLGRLLASLRPGRAGPLPVQTGFPTSLADLVVKNHGRLKKPSKPKKRRPNTPPSPSPPTSPLPPAVAAGNPTVQEKSSLAPVCASSEQKYATFTLGLEFLVLGSVVTLGLLVIWSKKLVACITVVSFALFLLDSVRSSAPRWLKPCPEARKKLDSAMVRLDLDGRGWVSPIREVGVETPRFSSADSDRGSDVSIERSELGDNSSSNSSSNPKSKRSWRKLIAKKLHKNKKCKEKDSFASCHGEAERESEEKNPGEANAEAEGNADSIRIGPSCNEMTLPEVTEAQGMELSREGNRGEGALLPLVFVSVVLLGLIAGKPAALVLTVLCFVFLYSSDVRGK